MVRKQRMTIMESAQKTAAGETSGISTGGGDTLVLLIDCTEFTDAGGTASEKVEFYVQTKDPVSGNWVDVNSTADVTVTATGKTRTEIKSEQLGTDIRVRWAFTDMTSATFSIGGIMEGNVGRETLTLLGNENLTADKNGDSVQTAAKKAAVFVDIAALTSGSVTVYLQAKDPASGDWFDVANSGSLSSTGTTRFEVADLVGADVRARADLAASSDLTLSVGYVGEQ